MKLRTDIHAGGNRKPGNPVPVYDGSRVNAAYPYGPSGWFWIPGGYLARPGKPLKGFSGWYYGSAPVMYMPASGPGLDKQELNGWAASGMSTVPGEGVLAPKAP